MADQPLRDRLLTPSLVCLLAAVTVLIATVGIAPPAVSAQDLLGDVRDPGQRAFIASHRGGAESAPENTLPAIQHALEAGFDYVEIDLVLTADGHAVLMHDATVDRTTDGSGAVAELTLAQIRALDAGSSYAAAYAGTPVPTAEEALDVIAAADGRAILDLKGEWTPAATALLVAQLDERDLIDRVAVASFDARTMAMIAADSAVVARLAILKDLPSDVVAAVQQAGARGIVVSRKALLRRPEVVKQLHDADLRVVAYTLNTDAQWSTATDLGVDGIVTDDPGMLQDWQRTLAHGR